MTFAQSCAVYILTYLLTYNLILGRRHLVNAYEVKAGIGVIAGNTV